MLLGWTYSSALAALGGIALVEVDRVAGGDATAGKKVK